MKIAVVTGFAGFIGSQLTELLLSKGWFIHGIDKLTHVANIDFIKNIQIKYPDTLKVQIKDISKLDKLPQCDVVFNLAAESDVDSSNEDSTQFIKSNILGVQTLLSIISTSKLLKTNKPLFFQVSTDEVYGDIASGSFNEEAHLNPSNPYSATKAAADLLIKSWHRTFDLDYIIVRPTNNYGENQYPEKLIPLAVKQLARGHKIKLHNSGHPERTWLHVKDTVEAILHIYNLGSTNNIYNISSNFTQSNVKTVKQIITSYFNSTDINIDEYIDLGYSRPGQDIRYAVNCKKLEQLGWVAKRDFNLELPLLVNSIKKNIIW